MLGWQIAVTAEIVILIENRKSIRTLLRDGFILGLASVLPIAWWLVVHNIMTYGSLWGVGPQVVDVGQNTSLALTKMLHWFVPYLTFLMPVLMRPLDPFGRAGSSSSVDQLEKQGEWTRLDSVLYCSLGLSHAWCMQSSISPRWQ